MRVFDLWVWVYVGVSCKYIFKKSPHRSITRAYVCSAAVGSVSTRVGGGGNDLRYSRGRSSCGDLACAHVSCGCSFPGLRV